MITNVKVENVGGEVVVQFWGVRGKKKSLVSHAKFALADKEGLRAHVAAEVYANLDEMDQRKVDKKMLGTVN